MKYLFAGDKTSSNFKSSNFQIGPMEILLKYFSDFTPTQMGQFEKLAPLYQDWNEKINVISRKDIDGLYLKHVLHSLSIAAKFGFQPNMQVIDIGSGGGFPGIPLAIFFPETHFHLVDSINKKLNVVRAVVEALDLKNVTVQHTRAEEIKNRKFDVAVSRAVAPLKDLLFWSKPLLGKKNPAFQKTGEQIPSGLICLKGGDLAQEIHDSKAQPKIWDVYEIFNEDYFKEKFMLQVG